MRESEKARERERGRERQTERQRDIQTDRQRKREKVPGSTNFVLYFFNLNFI